MRVWRVAIYLTTGIVAASCGTSDGPNVNAGGSGGVLSAGGSGQAGEGGDGGDGGDGEDVPPGAPTDFAVVLSTEPFGAAMTWTPPSDDDIAGYLIARSPDAAELMNDAPVDGTTYFLIDTLPGGSAVVYVDEDTSTVDGTLPIESVSHYAVWAVDMAGQWSAPAIGQLDVGFPVQQGVICVADPAGTPTVTVTTQPSHVVLGADASYDSATSTLALSVALVNHSSRILFNPKVVVDAVSDGSANLVTDGTTLEGLPAAYYGPAGLAVGGTRTRPMLITGVATDPVCIDVSVHNDPLLIVDSGYVPSLCLVDVSGARFNSTAARAFGGVVSFPSAAYTDGGNAGSLRGGVLSADGGTYWSGNRNLPTVVAIDMTTMEVTGAATLYLGPKATTSRVVESADGLSLYVMLMTNRHPSGAVGASELFLVKLERDTLIEQERLLIGDANAVQMGHPRFEPTVDGSHLLITQKSPPVVWVVDTSTMTLIDVDAVTAGVQGVAVGGSPRDIFIDPNGLRAIVAHARLNVPASVIDLSDYTVTTQALSNGTLGFRHRELVFDPSGPTLFTIRSGAIGQIALSAFNLTDSMVTDMVTIGVPLTRVLGSGAVHPNGNHLFVAGRQFLDKYDVTTLEEVDTDLDGVNGITKLAMATCSNYHHAMFTPF